jgi:hypothetical protein
MSHELERLRTAHERIAPPDPPVLDAIRRRLLVAGERERRRRPLRRLAVAGAVALAGAVVAVALSSGVTSPPVDAVAKARAALAAPGEIVHYTLRVTGADPGPGCETGPMEIWRAADPTRWRAVQPVPDAERCGSIDLQMGEAIVPPRVELAYRDGRLKTYVPGSDILQVIVDEQPSEGERRAPSDASNMATLQTMGTIARARERGESPPAIARVPDPVTGVEQLLAAGTLRDAGVRVRGGRRVRALAGGWTRPGGIERTEIEYVVDAETFAPIAMRATTHVRGGDTATVRATFGDYERIALTEQSAKLLEIKPERPPQVTRLTIEDIKG